jgi:TetR/AcrR family transcriptional regulator, transcriptional repressor of bet genes
MGRPSNTEERRAQIVEGLLTVMAERGYAAASIAMVAQAAGVAPGLVHYHFEDKQEILLALVDTLGQRARARRDAFVAHARTARTRLFAAIDALLAPGDGADPRAVACWVAIGAEAVRQPEVRQHYERLVHEAVGELEALLRDVLRSERRSTAKVGIAAAGLMAAVEGCFRLAAAAPDVIAAGSAAGLVRAIATGLIEAQDVRRVTSSKPLWRWTPRKP